MDNVTISAEQARELITDLSEVKIIYDIFAGRLKLTEKGRDLMRKTARKRGIIENY